MLGAVGPLTSAQFCMREPPAWAARRTNERTNGRTDGRTPARPPVPAQHAPATTPPRPAPPDPTVVPSRRVRRWRQSPRLASATGPPTPTRRDRAAVARLRGARAAAVGRAEVGGLGRRLSAADTRTYTALHGAAAGVDKRAVGDYARRRIATTTNALYRFLLPPRLADSISLARLPSGLRLYYISVLSVLRNTLALKNRTDTAKNR